MATQRPFRRRGLTATELVLSATATAALLATVLLPLGRATTEQARIATCLGNLRNLMVATNLYLADNADWYPLYVRSNGGEWGIAPWTYGGKTNSDWWWLNQWVHYYRYAERPLNPYILGGEAAGDVVDEYGNVIVRAEVEPLRCPSDKATHQREGPWRTDFVSTYEDAGTSYLFNLSVMFNPAVFGTGLDVRRADIPSHQFDTWFWSLHTRGATILTRDLLREVTTSIPGKYAAYLEDPMDVSLGREDQYRQLVGNHGEFSKHSMGFLDGHAEYRYANTRYFCGPGWYALNPGWLWDCENPPPSSATRRGERVYHYRNCLNRRCPEMTGDDPAGEPASPATFP